MTQMVLGPIVGGVHAHGVRLWARSDGPATLYAWLGKTPDLRDAFLGGKAVLTETTGFAGAVSVEGLEPNTRYHYALTLENHPPSPRNGPFPAFWTAPPTGARHSLAFAFGSCILLRRPQDERIFWVLDKRREQDDLRFWLLLGDQIYADAWFANGLGQLPRTVEDYRAVYRHAWSAPALRHLLAHLPAFMIWDDHEVDNDWYWTQPDRQKAALPLWERLLRCLHGRSPQLPRDRIQAAVQAYWEHQGLHGRPLLQPPQGIEEHRPRIQPQDEGHFGYTFTYGPAAFFVLDTRFHRVRSSRGSRLLNEAQWQALDRWLAWARQADLPFKFLVSSISVLSDWWLDFTRDRWNGFPQERQRLLMMLARHQVRGLYLLTGDLHAGQALRAELETPEGGSVVVWEFGATPFAQRTHRLARWLFRATLRPPLRRLERRFVVTEPHFGVVYLHPEPVPSVHFVVYDAEGRTRAQVRIA